MSFFKDLTKKFDDLRSDFSDEGRKPDTTPAGRRDYPGYQSQEYRQSYQPNPQQYQQPYQQPYRQPYQQPYQPEQQYRQQSQYGSYGGQPTARTEPPPPMPDSLPPLPSGWLAEFDPTSRHYYYVDLASHRSQWERPLPPGFNIPSRGFGQVNQPQQQGSRGSGKGSMLLGAAGGLAAGALISHALHDSDSDDERRDSYSRPTQSYQPAYAPQESYGYPDHDADGSSVSSSDRESVEEARERYEEAQAAAADSDASSSEEEELEEAREEYEEDYEDTYGDD